jgi:serine/threonine protein kinase
VCAAVSYAHQNLVVHRDLKPGNILVTAAGEPKLLDFGVAKLLADGGDPSTAPTATLLPALTPAYASPEQVKNEPITTASDVYSLGVVLYELLTGRLPYRPESASLPDLIKAVCETAPMALSAAARAAGDQSPATRAELEEFHVTGPDMGWPPGSNASARNAPPAPGVVSKAAAGVASTRPRAGSASGSPWPASGAASPPWQPAAPGSSASHTSRVVGFIVAPLYRNA